jgi:hypothetical protein
MVICNFLHTHTERERERGREGGREGGREIYNKLKFMVIYRN